MSVASPTSPLADWARLVEDEFSEAVTLRRRIHAEPELGLDNPKTRDAVVEALSETRLELHHCPRTSGVIAHLRGGSGGSGARPTILLRADTDALPMDEDTDLEFRSTIAGRMHACGHDAHTAMLVGAARLLDRRRDSLPGDVLFLFQPGEERWAGARHMLESGIFDAVPRADAAFAIHVEPQLPLGLVASRPGPMMGAMDDFEIEVIGRGGHGSMPHNANDPIPAACEIVLALQTMITRRLNAFEPVVLTVGQIEAGSAYNVIPERAWVRGTLRSTSRHARDLATEGITRIATGIAAAHDAEARVEHKPGYPVTVNDAAFTGFVRETIEQHHGEGSFIEMPTPVMGSEDFSYILERIPGTMVFLGARLEGAPRAPCHSNRMQIDEAAMRRGMALHAEIATAFLARGAAP